MTRAAHRSSITDGRDLDDGRQLRPITAKWLQACGVAVFAAVLVLLSFVLPPLFRDPVTEPGAPAGAPGPPSGGHGAPPGS
ncbi:MAG: hypothetical protein ACR2MB_06365 [Acidimicrobiales bacterium]